MRHPESDSEEDLEFDKKGSLLDDSSEEFTDELAQKDDPDDIINVMIRRDADRDIMDEGLGIGIYSDISIFREEVSTSVGGTTTNTNTTNNIRNKDRTCKDSLINGTGCEVCKRKINLDVNNDRYDHLSTIEIIKEVTYGLVDTQEWDELAEEIDSSTTAREEVFKFIEDCRTKRLDYVAEAVSRMEIPDDGP